MSFWGTMILIMIIAMFALGIIGASVMMAGWALKSEECAEKYGGKVARGYCTYVKDGNSKSYSIWREKLNETQEVENDN